jgi:hypothetical protein
MFVLVCCIWLPIDPIGPALFRASCLHMQAKGMRQRRAALKRELPEKAATSAGN